MMFHVVVLLAGSLCVNFVQSALTLDNESELREAQAALFNDNSQSGWLLLNYVAPSTIHFAAGGEGGVDEYKSLLTDDEIQYLLVRVSANEKPRDVFCTWIGPAVENIDKRKKDRYLGDAETILQPFHAAITILNKDNLSDDAIVDKSEPLSGSHVID